MDGSYSQIILGLLENAWRNGRRVVVATGTLVKYFLQFK